MIKKSYAVLRFMAGLLLLVVGFYLMSAHLDEVYETIGTTAAVLLVAIVVAMAIGAYECLWGGVSD